MSLKFRMGVFHVRSTSESFRYQRGFTLIELLMMLVIIGVLAGLGFVSISKVQARAAQARADAYWHDLMTAARSYQFDHNGSFPDMDALLAEQSPGPYLEATTWKDRAEEFGSDYSNATTVAYRLVKESEAVCVWFVGRGSPVESQYNTSECNV